MKEVVALAVKDLRLLIRDRVGFFFAFGFPLVYCIFFGTIFSGAGGGGTRAIKIAVVDQDGTEESREFVEALDAAEEFDVALTDQEDAFARVRRGKLTAYVLLPRGFGARRDGMFWGEPPQIELGIDPSRRAEAGMIRGLLIRSAFERMQGMFSDPELMSGRIDDWLAGVQAADDMDPVTRGALQLFLPSLASFARQMSAGGGGEVADRDRDGRLGGWQPLQIETAKVTRERKGPTNSYAISFPQGIIWGVLGCAAGFGISLVTERTRGTLVRLRMAPIARWQILAGKAGACFTTTAFIMVVLLLLAVVVFKVRPGSISLLVLAVFSTSIAFVGIMMFLSVLGKTEQAAGGIGWAVLLFMAMIGGGMVPTFLMPPWLLSLSHISPVKWAILSMEGAIWRGFSFTEMVWPCAILIAVGVLFFAIGVRAFRWTE